MREGGNGGFPKEPGLFVESDWPFTETDWNTLEFWLNVNRECINRNHPREMVDWQKLNLTFRFKHSPLGACPENSACITHDEEGTYTIRIDRCIRANAAAFIVIHEVNHAYWDSFGFGLSGDHKVWDFRDCCIDPECDAGFIFPQVDMGECDY